MIEEKQDKLKTIVVKESTYSRLTERKIHPNQSFDEIIAKILDSTVSEEFKQIKDVE